MESRRLQKQMINSRARAFARRIVLMSVAIAMVAPAMSAQAQTVIKEAAEALGGAARVSSVKNITLVGYGQYAYMFGGGRITGSPDAPEKYQAANDLRRVYDLEHGRFQQLERRNMLFPFLIAGGHNFLPVNLVLDGDVGLRG